VRRAQTFVLASPAQRREPADILRVELVTQLCPQTIDAEMAQVVVEVKIRRRYQAADNVCALPLITLAPGAFLTGTCVSLTSFFAREVIRFDPGDLGRRTRGPLRHFVSIELALIDFGGNRAAMFGWLYSLLQTSHPAHKSPREDESRYAAEGQWRRSSGQVKGGNHDVCQGKQAAPVSHDG
jgi:hypothetical protein